MYCWVIKVILFRSRDTSDCCSFLITALSAALTAVMDNRSPGQQSTRARGGSRAEGVASLADDEAYESIGKDVTNDAGF